MRCFNRVGLLIMLALVLMGGVVMASVNPETPPDTSAKAVAAATAGNPEELKAMNEMVDKALAAFNSGDFKGFYADYAKSMAGIATEQAFKTLYVDNYMATFGKYQSRTQIKEQTVITADSPVALVAFEGVFEKNPKTKISVNFTKEDGVWKVMQIQFAPM